MANMSNAFSRTLAMFTMLLTGLALNTTVYATPKPEFDFTEITELEEKPSDFFDHFYTTSKSDGLRTTAIFVSKSELAFDDRWEKTFKAKVSPSYKRYITETYSQLIQEQLVEAIKTSKRFTVAETKNDADLILTPSINDLYINGPEYIGSTSTYINVAGRGEFNLKATRPNGNVIAVFIDNRETRTWAPSNTMREATRAQNYLDFKFLMKRWAEEAIKLIN